MATLGLCSRTGTAVAVALGERGGRPVLLGRWALELTGGTQAEPVPAQVFHAAAGLPPPEADALVRRAVDAVTETAGRRLAEVCAELGADSGGPDAVAVVVGDFPVPESVPAILASHTLMHAAEGQLYRDALLDAADAAGLRATGVSAKVASARLAGDLGDVVRAVGAAAGPPWRKEHKLAAVAALTCG